MRRSLLVIGAASLALLSACTPEQQQAIDSMMDDGSSDAMMKDDDVMMNEESAMMKKVTYAGYDSSVLMNGETKVLFFHAAWCPVCRAANTELEEWYAAGLPTRNVYKVDYDTETELKSKYGVTYQHTFVLVDGEGNAIQTVQGPSDAVLQTMIGVQN